MNTILASVIIISSLALLFGFVLAVAAKKFTVKKNPITEKINDILPGANCGACGYPGCSGYAEAIVANLCNDTACNNENCDACSTSGDTNFDITLCSPGGADVVKQIASIVGLEADIKNPKVAIVKCNGSDLRTKIKYNYNGTDDCRAAMDIFEGFSECDYACLGLGSCVKVCKFDAIDIDKYGNVLINSEKCTGCGECVKACPKFLIEMVPATSKVHVLCKSIEKGKFVNQQCKVGCIGCMKCVKVCPTEAITVNNFLATIEYDKCTSCGLCVEVCPKDTIIKVGETGQIMVASDYKKQKQG